MLFCVKLSSGLAAKKTSNQPAQLQRLARQYDSPESDQKDADKTAQMRRLVCASVVPIQQSDEAQ